MIENEKRGTLDNSLFPVVEYINKRCDNKMNVFEGYNIDNAKFESVSNTNNSAFLKAVLQHLLPCETLKLLVPTKIVGTSQN